MTQELPTKAQADAALAYMAQEIHAPAFFQKVAEYGFEPRTLAEAEQMLELGAVLHKAEADGQYKSAAVTQQEQRNPFLDAVLARFTPQAQAEDGIKTAAAEAVRTDAMAKAAALVYNHCMSGGALQEDEAEPATETSDKDE